MAPFSDEKTHFTFITTRHRVIVVGSNNDLVHAEVDALSRFREYRRHNPITGRLYLINMRISATGRFGMSRPCHHCACFIQKHVHSLDHIFYTTMHLRWADMAMHQFSFTLFPNISSGHRRPSSSPAHRRRHRRKKILLEQ